MSRAKPPKRKSPLDRIVRDCRYLRGYIFDTQYTIQDMEEAGNKGVCEYALKEMDYIREYLGGITDRIYRLAQKEEK